MSDAPRALVITVSDSVAAGDAVDTSGPEAAERLKARKKGDRDW